MKPEIETAIRESNQKNQIVLKGMEITDEMIPDIMALIIELHPDTTAIFMDDNHISPEGASIIADMLVTKPIHPGLYSQSNKKLPQLIYLDLQFNKLEKAGYTTICSLRKTYPDLDLALCGNGVTDHKTAKQIAEQFKPDSSSQFSNNGM